MEEEGVKTAEWGLSVPPLGLKLCDAGAAEGPERGDTGTPRPQDVCGRCCCCMGGAWTGWWPQTGAPGAGGGMCATPGGWLASGAPGWLGSGGAIEYGCGGTPTSRQTGEQARRQAGREDGKVGKAGRQASKFMSTSRVQGSDGLEASKHSVMHRTPKLTLHSNSAAAITTHNRRHTTLPAWDAYLCPNQGEGAAGWTRLGAAPCAHDVGAEAVAGASPSPLQGVVVAGVECPWGGAPYQEP